MCVCTCEHVCLCVSVSGTNRSLSLLAKLSRQLADQLKELTDPTKHCDTNDWEENTHIAKLELHFLCLHFQDINF